MSFSIYCVFGKKGFGYEKDEQSIYIRFGFMTLCITSADIESILSGLLSELKEKDNIVSIDVVEFENTVKELEAKLEKKLVLSEEDKKYISNLEDEIVDINDDNDELKDEIVDIKQEVANLKSEIKYINAYFHIG